MILSDEEVMAPPRQAWEDIADESKRLAIVQLLTNTLRAILASTPGDLLPALYLCLGRVAPSHTGIELGVGDSILIKVGHTLRSLIQNDLCRHRAAAAGCIQAAAPVFRPDQFRPVRCSIAIAERLPVFGFRSCRQAQSVEDLLRMF